MAAIVVVEQNRLGRLDTAREDVPARHDEVAAFGERRVLRQAASGDHHGVGIEGQNVLGLGPEVVADADSEPLELGQPPVDDADELAAARVLDGQADLTAGLGGGLQHRHLVAALGGDPRRLKPGRAGADHDDAAARAVGAAK